MSLVHPRPWFVVHEFKGAQQIDYRRFTRRGAEGKKERLMDWSLRPGYWFVYHVGGAPPDQPKEPSE